MKPKSALNVVLRMSRWAGVAPITDSISGLCISRPLTIYSYLLVTAINCVVLSGFALDLLTEPARSLRVRTPTSRVIWVGNLTIIILIASVAVYRSPARMTSVIRCLNEIEKMKNFIGAKCESDAGENYKMLTVVLTCVGLWILICFDLCGYALEAIAHGREVRTLLMYSFLFYEYFLVLLSQLQFMLIAFHLQSSLRLLNFGLRNLLPHQDKRVLPINGNVKQNPEKQTETFKKIYPKTINYVVDSLGKGSKGNDMLKQSRLEEKRTVNDFAIAYGWVCDIFRDIDKEHGLLLLLNLASFFLQLVITPYYLITDLYTSPQHSLVLNLLLQIGWGIFHVACMMLVVEPCYQMHNEMAKTKSIICCLMRRVTVTDTMLKELDLFIKQLLLDRPTYSPLGVCTLSRPLTVTIIGSVTTYLVIIFQFRTFE